MNSTNSGYVLAGFETLSSVLEKFKETMEWDSNFTPSNLSNFFSKNLDGFLHSYGQNFPGRKSYKNYNKKEADLFIKCRQTGYFDNSLFIADSGGFQISIGRLTRKESDLLQKLYYEWLEEYHHVLDRAFILDIPPGPECKIFKTFDDIFNVNLNSYNRARNLPKEVRDKIIYVHHFRTPKLWEIYTNILRHEDLFKDFQYHATGGIVANLASDVTLPCIVYVLPLVPLLSEAIRHKRKYLNFHILGGATPRDIFFYELFKKHVKKIHDVELNITFDSSGIYKQVMIGRFLLVFDSLGHLRKLTIKSKDLNKRFDQNKSVYEFLSEKIDAFSKRWNFKQIDLKNLYSPETGTFWKDVRIYLMLFSLSTFSLIKEMVEERIQKIYHLYEQQLFDEFSGECIKLTQALNGGKVTKKQRIKSSNVIRSLDILSDLDEEYCEHIVNKYFERDEYIFGSDQELLTL